MSILYVVGTPIGNLGDISERALETLEQVDFIAAEDTRVTLKLLNHFGIKKPMVSYFEHNKEYRGQIICDRIKAGESCAIVTDAGMPCISDPGELLIKQCEEYPIKTVVVPGPSAVISALCVSGLATGRFCFEGFLSMTKKEREKPSIINPSRKRRIAAGSGMRVEDVNRLLKQYESMRQLMKKMKSMGKKGGRSMPMGFGGRGLNPFGF